MEKGYLTEEPWRAIDEAVDAIQPDKVLVVTDENVGRLVLPLLDKSRVIRESASISIPPGEEAKNIDTVAKVWDKLEEISATRKSLIINIGGGVVTDLGGFAAATFKRGISTVNFPTTLLGAVDAATGGKTGIDYKGLKNEIGAFHLPSRVIVSALPFATLPQKEILSGYAEMVKTALISDREFYFSLLDVEKVLSDSRLLGEAVEFCIKFKDEVVANDPKEKGLRKILNFGHTAGHAFESLMIERGLDITHGRAVAHGILVALILSHIRLGLGSGEVGGYAQFLKNHYGAPLIMCGDIDEAINKMNSDKKNQNYGEPLFTLLREPGVPEINCRCTPQEIREALELYIDYAE